MGAVYEAATPEATPTAPKRADRFYYDALGSRMGLNYVASRGAMNFARRNNGLNQYWSWENNHPLPDPLPWGSAFYYDDDFGTPPAPPWIYPGNGVTMADGTITASYNALNQPVAIYSPSLPAGDFLWLGFDPLGRCVKRRVAPAPATGNSPAATNPATYFYYDGWNMIQEGASATNPARIYVPTASGWTRLWPAASGRAINGPTIITMRAVIASSSPFPTAASRSSMRMTPLVSPTSTMPPALLCRR